MNFIKNLKIKEKLTLLLLLLLIPLLYFVIMTLRQGFEESRELDEVSVKLTESEKISDFLHQFQRESARMLAAAEGDSLMQLEAVLQREKTDAAAVDLKRFMEGTERLFTDISLIDQLNRYRSELDLKTINEEGFRIYSINLIYRFLDRIDENAVGIGNYSISRNLISFKNLVETKIHLGRLRGLLTRVVAKKEFTYQSYGLFSIQNEAYTRSVDNFIRYASAASKEELQIMNTSPNHKSMVALLKKFEQSPAFNSEDYHTVRVYNLFSNIIEKLSKIEDNAINTTRAQVIDESALKTKQLAFSIGLLILILGVAMLLSLYIINLISASLSRLKIAADQVKLGASDVTIQIDSKDEIGDVANAFRGLIQKNINLTKVAHSIGQGNYDVEVTLYSQQDILSAAILEMKENLQQFSREGSNRNWIMSGITELNNLLTAKTSLEGIAQNVVAFMCTYTRAEAGVLYLYDNQGMLYPKASYGVKLPFEKLQSFRLGTGVLGQAVSEKKIKILDDVPADYLKFESGLTEITPATVIILPLHFSDTIVGALELSARHEYTYLEREFFKTSAERLSTLIHTLSTHMRTQELLYETQNQAEELETQQEELRQLNAELSTSEEELKVSQEELQEKNSELEEKAQQLEEQFEALENKNQALEDARQAIELKMQQVETVSKYKSDFLANMSHELRTPLNSILILSRLLADNTTQNLSDKQAEHAQIIHQSGADLLRLINEILDLSKIESGQVKLELEPLNITELSIHNSFKELAESKQVLFRVDITEGMERVITTDRFRLEQILRNFLSNAFKFTTEGGSVTLSIYPLNSRKVFNSEYLNQQQDIIAFAVHDSGIGIATEKQELIFEAFQQADTSTTRKFGGTGLGLTISRELASLLGGEIELQSSEGEGSTFTLYLPKSLNQRTENSTVQQPKEIKETKEVPLKKLSTPVSKLIDDVKGEHKHDITLLIIEDDKGFSELLADFAVAKNFHVHQAYNGNDGLRLATEVKPDAILLDINLPDISGWEVLRQIRETKDLRHVNVHVMSAYDREVVGDHLQQESYLPKPVTLEMLNKAFTSIGEVSHNAIENILIVEDNNIENKAISELLLSHGLKSVSAYDTKEAEKILSRQKIDCIILDINLPGMKGNVWMESIRAKKGLADIPIIIYSGKDLNEAEEAKLKRFANTIIIKNEYSYIRLMDEVQLFLHKVNQKLPTAEEYKLKLHLSEEILQNKKALIVDDDVRNVYSLSSMLEMQGMELMVAYNGKEAIEKLENNQDVDIVLMDVMMPEMDGIEAIRNIRQHYKFKQLPIIALTAKAMKGDKEKCLQAGASDYITKPVDTEKLLTLMRVWLYEA